MKKFYLFTASAGLVLLLAACGGNQSTTSTTSSSSETSSSIQQTSTKESESKGAQASTSTTTTTSAAVSSSSDSSKASSTESSSASTATTSSSAVTASSDGASKNAGTVLDQLQAEHPTIPLPKTVPTDGGKQLGVAAGDTDQGFSVLYYALDQQVPLNDQRLNNETPISQYLYQSGFGSSQAAVDAMQIVPIDKTAPTVDLGHHITGYQQGAAGSRYIEWQEGNWQIRVRASTIEGQDPLPLAKQTVEYLETAMLPAPELAGTIEFNMNEGGVTANSVNWQKGEAIYHVMNVDPMNALKSAVSMNK